MNENPICPICGKEILEKEIFIFSETKEIVIHEQCDFNRRIASLILIQKLLEGFNSADFLQTKFFSLLRELDLLELRPVENYEDLDEAEFINLIKEIKDSLFLNLLHVNKILAEYIK